MTLNCASTCPVESIAATVVRPGPTPNTNSELALAGRTSATLGSATNTLAASASSVSTRPPPDSSVIGITEARVAASAEGRPAGEAEGCTPDGVSVAAMGAATSGPTGGSDAMVGRDRAGRGAANGIAAGGAGTLVAVGWAEAATARAMSAGSPERCVAGATTGRCAC